MPAQVPADEQECRMQTTVLRKRRRLAGRQKQEIFVSFVILLSLLADMSLGEKLRKCDSVNLVGMVYCAQSVSFSDFDRFLCKSVCCLVEGAVMIS